MISITPARCTRAKAYSNMVVYIIEGEKRGHPRSYYEQTVSNARAIGGLSACLQDEYHAVLR